MTQHTAGPSLGCHPTPPDYTPPLRLKPKPPPSGYVDGAWWPYSDDLLQELPDLLAVLSVRLGPIQRVLYNLGEWAQAPAKVAMGGRIGSTDTAASPSALWRSAASTATRSFCWWSLRAPNRSRRTRR
jgi:hypothetical protein